MSQSRINAIAKALEQLSADLEALDKVGEGLPTVEKNVVRMRGALHVLQIQFTDLAELGKTA